MFPSRSREWPSTAKPPTTMPGRVIRARNTPNKEAISLVSMSVLSGVFLLRMLAALVDWRAAACKLHLATYRRLRWNYGSACLFAICAASAESLHLINLEPFAIAIFKEKRQRKAPRWATKRAA